MNTETYSTPAPMHFAVPRPRVSMWATPVQGMTLPVPAIQLGCIDGMTSTTTANAANGATRKDASGGEAFEDPV